MSDLPLSMASPLDLIAGEEGEFHSRRKTMISRSLAISGAAVALILSGCAATQPEIEAAHVGSPGLKTVLGAGVAEPTVDAGDHEVSSAVRAGLIEAFDRQAQKAGVKIVAGGVPVKISVVEYSTRSNVARVMLGVLAGRDHIKATVNVGDARFDVEDSAHSAINGIDVVAEDVGIEAANGVAKLAGLPVGQ
ncbi:DUF4410 domain-containing protein [Trinickia caryophylli]|nr:DUF4410 domain-containing protein [Trinickia caryophylli]WQE10103.1 DUF4410 domain-containing protein [Trinickia caryophylli]